MKKCGDMEREKLWEFSTEKSNWMCQKNRKRKVEDIEVDVKQGRIGKVRVYKYLGNMVNEDGNMDDQLKLMESKIGGIVCEGKRICCRSKIGKYEIEGKKLIYEQTAECSVFYNVEVWTNFRQSDKDKMESIQGKLLKGLFGLPKTTPYWGLLFELDVMPILYKITYKRVMLYHNIVNSEDEREIKHVVHEQEVSGYENCWFGNLKKEGMEIDVMVKEEEVKREEKVNMEEGSKRKNKIGSGEKDGGEKKCEQEDEVPQEIRK